MITVADLVQHLPDLTAFHMSNRPMNHNYEFVQVDVGAEGRCCNGGVCSNIRFAHLLQHPRNPLKIPAPKEVNGYIGELPYFFVGVKPKLDGNTDLAWRTNRKTVPAKI